jgi:hypothetical protein
MNNRDIEKLRAAAVRAREELEAATVRCRDAAAALARAEADARTEGERAAAATREAETIERAATVTREQFQILADTGRVGGPRIVGSMAHGFRLLFEAHGAPAKLDLAALPHVRELAARYCSQFQLSPAGADFADACAFALAAAAVGMTDSETFAALTTAGCEYSAAALALDSTLAAGRIARDESGRLSNPSAGTAFPRREIRPGCHKVETIVFASCATQITAEREAAEKHNAKLRASLAAAWRAELDGALDRLGAFIGGRRES